MNLRALAEELAERKAQFDGLILPYWRVLIADDPRIKSNEFPEYIELEEDGVVLISEEYNDSCHCHPEMRSTEFYIGHCDLELTVEEFAENREKIKADEKRREKEQKRREKELKRQKRETDSKKEQAAERATFEKLKIKYGDS